MPVFVRLSKDRSKLRRGQTWFSVFDELGAPSDGAAHLFDAPAPQPLVDTWTKTFDIQGQLTQESSPTGVIGYEYDPLGRKTRVWAGAVGSTDTTGLSDITFSYDLLGRLATVNTVKRDRASIPTESTTHHYDLLGRMDYTEMPNEVVEDYTLTTWTDWMSCGISNLTLPTATWPTTL